MKRVLIAVLILATIITLGILEQIFIKNTMNALTDSLIELKTALLNGEDGIPENDNVLQVWESKHRLFETLVPHNETKEIYIKISEIDGFISGGDTENALSVTITLLDLIEYTAHLLYYLPEHIF